MPRDTASEWGDRVMVPALPLRVSKFVYRQFLEKKKLWFEEWDMMSSNLIKALAGYCRENLEL